MLKKWSETIRLDSVQWNRRKTNSCEQKVVETWLCMDPIKTTHSKWVIAESRGHFWAALMRSWRLCRSQEASLPTASLPQAEHSSCYGRFTEWERVEECRALGGQEEKKNSQCKDYGKQPVPMETRRNRLKIIAQGLRLAKRRNWEKVGEETLKLYKFLIISFLE